MIRPLSTGHGSFPLFCSNFAANSFASGVNLKPFDFFAPLAALDLAMASLIILSIIFEIFFSSCCFCWRLFLYFFSFFLI